MFFAFVIFIVLGSTPKIAPYINPLLDRYGKYLRTALLVLAFVPLGLLFVPDLIEIKETGGAALELLWIILFIPILSKVFNQSLAKKFILWRKELGILMGMLALVHGLQYFSFGNIFQNIMDTTFWASSLSIPFVTVGMIALVISTLLLVTSNLYSQKKLKKYWKMLHRLAYPLLFLVILHVILIQWSKSGQIPWEELILPIIYFTLKIMEWRGISFFGPTKEVKGE